MKLFVTPLPSQSAALPQDLFEELIQLGIPAEPAIAVPVTPQASKGVRLPKNYWRI